MGAFVENSRRSNKRFLLILFGIQVARDAPSSSSYSSSTPTHLVDLVSLAQHSDAISNNW